MPGCRARRCADPSSPRPWRATCPSSGSGAGDAAGTPAFDPAGAVSSAPARPSPVAAARDPEQRWAAAVARQPLASPVPLPQPFQALSTAITGRSTPVRFTSGPATRRALSAAGARGATTGNVIHLPDPPTSSAAAMGVLAHELAHTRSPVVRPRFLLHAPSGFADADEHAALGTGRRVQDVLERSAPVGGRPGARAAGRRAVGGRGRGRRRAAGRSSRRQHPGLDALPTAWTSATGSSPAALAGGAAVTSGAGSVAGAAAGRRHSPWRSRAPGAAAASGCGRGPGGSRARPAPWAPAGRLPSAWAAPDMDRLVEALEQRMLAEVERRGGRWTGLF